MKQPTEPATLMTGMVGSPRFWKKSGPGSRVGDWGWIRHHRTLRVAGWEAVYSAFLPLTTVGIRRPLLKGKQGGEEVKCG